MINPAEILIDKAMRAIAAALAAGRLKTMASGVENIPARGPVLIVARNYHHLFDGLALFAALPRPFHVVVTVDWTRNRRTRFFMETITRIARWPVLLRADGLVRVGENSAKLFSPGDVPRYLRRAFRQAVDLLVEGRIVVVFPEGYPNIDPAYTPKTELDEFLPFKPGFIKILGAAEKRMKQKIPIIPAGLCYTPGKPWLGRLRFGTPVYSHDSRGPALIDIIEKTVKNLSASAGSAPPG